MNMFLEFGIVFTATKTDTPHSNQTNASIDNFSCSEKRAQEKEWYVKTDRNEKNEDENSRGA